MWEQCPVRAIITSWRPCIKLLWLLVREWVGELRVLAKYIWPEMCSAQKLSFYVVPTLDLLSCCV